MSESPVYLLGISAYYHDSAAALLRNGVIVAAAQEERFSRKKHDAGFPAHAVRYVLEEAGVGLDELRGIAFYDKPFLKFERLLETYHAFAPRGLLSFLASMPVWIKEKLFMRKMLHDGFAPLLPSGAALPPLHFPEHHLSHAASAFYPSPFADAAILTVDGVGEWVTTSLGRGDGKDITTLRELHFPHSLGLLYSAFTAYCGFKVNSGEYKLMGLAPYGNPRAERTREFARKIRESLIDVREDGSFVLNMDYFAYATGLRMYDAPRWQALFGIPPRTAESETLEQEYMDMALAVQEVTEDVVLRLARTARRLTGCANLCLAGGVALNCVANGKLLREKIFDHVWIQPAAGDAGGALGAALALWHIGMGQPRLLPGTGGAPRDGMCAAPDNAPAAVSPNAPTAVSDTAHAAPERAEAGPAPIGSAGGSAVGGAASAAIDVALDAMHGSYLGPAFDAGEIARACRRCHAVAHPYTPFDALCAETSDLLAAGKVVGWFQGRMEYGPRALGNRSILGDPRALDMQKRLNLKIKYREGFRPFAPSVLEEEASRYFALDGTPSPYMLLVAPVAEDLRRPLPEGYEALPLWDRLYWQRSELPAVTHVDYSARVQSVSRRTNPRYWQLLDTFRRRTGCPVLVNTSFNVRGEPVVCTPEDAYRCFMRTEMDILVLGDSLLRKEEQPPLKEHGDWRQDYTLD